MAVRVACVTDPACVWSWALEPVVRALTVEFAAEVEWTFAMGGLARQIEPAARDATVRDWLEASAASGMPADPLGWYESPLGSTYPACMAVKAAQEQSADAGARYLRVLREGIVCRRRKLDTAEALVEQARAAGLDAERFRVDLGSNATVEALGADLERGREWAAADGADHTDGASGRGSRPPGAGGVLLPTLRIEGDGGPRTLRGLRDLSDVRAAMVAAGARPADAPRPGVLDALRRFGALAEPEVAAVCDLPLPRAQAELAQLTLDWRVRPVPVLAARLWELA